MFFGAKIVSHVFVSKTKTKKDEQPGKKKKRIARSVFLFFLFFAFDNLFYFLFFCHVRQKNFNSTRNRPRALAQETKKKSKGIRKIEDRLTVRNPISAFGCSPNATGEFPCRVASMWSRIWFPHRQARKTNEERSCV